MKLFSDYEELESLALQAYTKHKENDSDPCYLVPAFSGLFCPWWQETARGTIAGLTADVDKGDMVYAALRSSVYQTYDVLRVATLAHGGDSGSDAALVKPREIVVDGGLANSSVLMQSLADILGKPTYPGSVSFAGATVNWLRTKMKLFSDYEELESLALQAYTKHKENDSDPCYLVPAFSGLFCPWWQETARGTIAGLTADVDKGDMVYAALRSSVYQTYDVLRVATLAHGGDSGSDAALVKPREIVVDGGLANSSVLMQSLADILDVLVRRHNHTEMMTALGAAVAAALAVGIDPSGLLKLRQYPVTETHIPHTFSSELMPHSRQVMLAGWHAAVERSLGWIESASPTEASDTLLELLTNVKETKSKEAETLQVSKILG
ncbi:hypothetical protein AHF37_11131 [Paragonimus kellicotti]|nr:hypothetical protein AHF37_11131 [Paragonimus kellicotti]